MDSGFRRNDGALEAFHRMQQTQPPNRHSGESRNPFRLCRCLRCERRDTTREPMRAAKAPPHHTPAARRQKKCANGGSLPANPSSGPRSRVAAKSSLENSLFKPSKP
ncbi:hypothetical protein SAMN05421681_101764 [Lysobacter enzymogenes]|nr:hypothetical protein SAMN05421681_101764 [Lysobacter enzymogenes]